MTELEHRYAKISLLKVGIAIIGFFLLMSVAVTRCLFNEKGIMNIVTTTTYLLKEQQYYNQIICVSAKDAGFNQNETNKIVRLILIKRTILLPEQATTFFPEI